MVCPSMFVASITAIAILIAEDHSNDELNELSVILMQLADTLSTIVVMRNNYGSNITNGNDSNNNSGGDNNNGSSGGNNNSDQ